MTKVVLDTNVIVSALLQTLGPSSRILLLALDRSIQMCVSGEIYAEYEEVIRRPRFRMSDYTIESFLRSVREHGLWVRPTARIQACADPDDDIFLECAQSAAAAYLITGNTKDFPPAWPPTEIVTPRYFVDLWASGRHL